MKFLKYLPALSCVAVLWSCGTATPEYVIGVSQCSDDEWRQKMNNEILTEALLYDNIRVEIRSANDNNRRQIDDIRYFIDRKVDLLVVSPNEAVPITPVVEEAFNSGIPVVVVDRKILSDSYTAFIGADNYLIGKTIGEYVADRLNGHTRIVELTGLNGSTPAIERHQGFMSVMVNNPDAELLTVADASWSRSEARSITDSLLSVYPRIDIVFAHNDRMAYGAYLAAYDRGREGGISFIGIDAVQGKFNGVGLVSDGILDATFIYPTGGDKVVQTAMAILEARAFPRETLLSTAIVDHTNARLMELQASQILEQEQKIHGLNDKINSNLLRYTNLRVISFIGLLCLVMFVVLLIATWRSLRLQNRLNLDLRLSNDEITLQKEQLEAQRDQLIELSRQLEEATQAKLVFFTNISHDFRTPLTLVADPIEQLLADGGLTDEQRYLLELTGKNVNILLRLVNQILDFRKYENGKLDLEPVDADLLACVDVWNDSFLPLMRSKHIKFSFESDNSISYRAAMDIEKMERAYFNIVSNAVKFTPQNGHIKVRLSSVTKADGTHFRLSVTNSGSYIPSGQIDMIFNRFYQVDRNNTGSGIGLALTRAFVELHGGTISVESDREEGTCFIVDIPVRTVLSAAASNLPASLPDVVSDQMGIEDHSPQAKYDETGRTMLVIDDNPDIRTYIRKLFSRDFHVIEAADGQEGIHKAVRYVPDIIISDVLMPVIDGIECCLRLKDELRTSHIPIILLTACSLDEQRIEGLRSGADAYLAKPFNSQVLAATVHNLIGKHNKLKQYFSENHSFGKENVGPREKEFIERFRELIDRNIHDPELNVEMLGKKLGVNRVQLYRKVKALTNFAPNELLRIARLHKAKALLASSELTIAEIAYRTGFNTPSYFTRCFKEQYGENPADYLKKKKAPGKQV